MTPTQCYVMVAKTLGLQTAIGRAFNRMNITCRCRSTVVLDEYGDNLMYSYQRT